MIQTLLEMSFSDRSIRNLYSSSAVDLSQTLPGKNKPPAKDDFKAL